MGFVYSLPACVRVYVVRLHCLVTAIGRGNVKSGQTASAVQFGKSNGSRFLLREQEDDAKRESYIFDFDGYGVYRVYRHTCPQAIIYTEISTVVVRCLVSDSMQGRCRNEQGCDVRIHCVLQTPLNSERTFDRTARSIKDDARQQLCCWCRGCNE